MAAAIAACCFGILSCPNPLNEEMLLHVKDQIGPVITILSPANGSSYAATVVVSGTVRDFSASSGEAGKVKSLRYEALATALAGDVDVSENGAFSFWFSTTNLSGSIVIKLTAEDWNGNIKEASLTLVDQGAIPSFAADPGNANVTLTWDPVPLSERYTVYYEKTNAIPNELFSLKIENARSPLVVSNLKNGDMHAFLLRSHSSLGEDNWSNVIKAIPLSPAHLAPRLTPGFKDILVEWNPISATDEYEVWKSTAASGPFINVSGEVRGRAFRDSAVQHGHHYYYAVRPAAYNKYLSAANQAELNRIPADSEREIGFFDTPGTAQGVAVSGSYAYVADYSSGLRVIRLVP